MYVHSVCQYTTTPTSSQCSFWEHHVTGSFSPIRREPVHLTLYSDASLEGWEGTDEITCSGRRVKCLTTSMPWNYRKPT